MKTKTYLCAAFAAALALNTTAFADQSNRSSVTQAHGGNTPVRAAATDDSPMTWRVARYPFRVGYTVVRTPLILGHTFTGKRTFVSNRGFFEANEEAAAADQRNTIPQGRGQRTLAR